MTSFKDFRERYCPYAQTNVPVEVTYNEKGEPQQGCLNSFKCPRKECAIYIQSASQLTIYKTNAIQKKM